MKLGILIISMFFAGLFLNANSMQATPVRLTVQPRSTNQIELTFGPVVPGVWYEVLTRTNGPDGHWMTFAGPFVAPSNSTIRATSNLGGNGELSGMTMETLRNWTFVAGWWDDNQGDELPALYKDLVLRCDPYAPADPYGNPMGDGWNNLQKLQSNMDPLREYRPPGPSGVDVGYYINGAVQIKWSVWGGPMPDYFLIERAERTARMDTNWMTNSNLSQPHFDYRARLNTNRLGNPYLSRTNFVFPVRPLRTNFPFRAGLGSGFRMPHGPPQIITVTGPFRAVARVQPISGMHDYRWSETNDPSLGSPLHPEPVYRLSAHYTPGFHASLNHVDAASIRQTILTVQALQTINGYNLTAFHPIPYGRYLLLVRDQNNAQWRASGYFTSGTNRDPLHLQVDSRGMMVGTQNPVSMPEVKFVPKVVKPEFTAGWGEDSDGDGLPDIYEVLVTHTEPDNADTRSTGILDGYKEMTGDGWSNLEKFRRRLDPFTAIQTPAVVVLAQPTLSEVMQTLEPSTDLHYQPQVEMRVVGTTNFYPIQQALWMLYRLSDTRDPYHVRGNFDLRISCVIPKPQPPVYGSGP
jgi:hypothetical protein